MKVCHECGTELNEEVDVCPLCGNSVGSQKEAANSRYIAPQQTDVSQTPVSQGKNLTDKSIKELMQDFKRVSGNALQTANFEAEGEEPSFTVAGVKINISLIIKTLAVALCVLFFCPLFKVNCYNMEISFSGFNAVIGKTISGMGSNEHIKGNLGAVLLFVTPTALFLVHHFKNKNAAVKKNVPIISVILCAAGIISFIVLAIIVNNQLESTYGLVKAKYTFFYALSIILYIISGLLSLLLYVASKKKRE